MVKLISLYEPWATMMALGFKKIETRNWWDTPWRGPLAIQAAKGGLSIQGLKATCCRPVFSVGLSASGLSMDGRRHIPLFPHGCIVAIVDLVDCLPVEGWGCLPSLFEEHPALDTTYERSLGNYAVRDPNGRRRWGWVTENLFKLPQPIPYRAHQGMNTLPQSVIDQIVAQGWKQP